MLHITRWRTIAIIAAVLLAVVMALPNVLPADMQAKLREWNLRPVTLGLDLQGGSNVLLEVDRADLYDKLTRQLSSDVRNAMRDAKIGYSGLARADGEVRVRVTKPEDVEKAETQLKTLLSPLESGMFSASGPVNLFVLKRDGQQFTFSFSPDGLDAKIALAVSQSLRIVENRVNALGTSEPVIQQQGKDRIVVQLPGVQNPDQVKSVIGRTAKLTFQLLCEAQPTTPGQNPPPECQSFPLQDDPEREMWVQSSSRATVDGGDLVDARGSFDQNNNAVVSFRFNTQGADRFARLTRDNVGRPFAIILDEKVVSYPNINEPILGGSGQISGNFTVEETNDLAVVLRSGALPAKLTIVEERTVGPSLGSDSIRAGIFASLIGLALVLAFMIFGYGLFGIFANFALLVNLLALIAIMSFFGFTLTLPGIAGIVLTMGMAVDSNVLIYERIREEWRNGRSALSAIETGFKAALGTIWDANLTTLVAALALFGVGSGPIRGFAVTLFIGIVTTMLTAFALTQFIVAVWVKYRRPKEVPL
ncbi:protein translocase subunit SecD [Aestuariivirga sp.]|jgi:protein-export membrane protein SecD|uniref:protein translocase subunit SecD n=1 Tax=Aestuariivirga sp. TaxID=2650926 RepID=UPI0037830FCD